MDETRLQEIEERANATPTRTFGNTTAATAEFIANARTDVPDLIAAVRERDARIADLEQQIVDGSDRARRAADEAAARIAELEAALKENDHD